MFLIASDVTGWDNFFIAAAGAAGALAGLVFVALSINLARIIERRDTTGRAAETLVLLGATLFGALLSLMPNPSTTWIGIVACIVGIPAWCLPTFGHIRLGRTHEYYKWGLLLLRMTLHQAATLPYLIGAVLLLSNRPGGMLWFAAGLLLSMVVALLSAWILLVEIIR